MTMTQRDDLCDQWATRVRALLRLVREDRGFIGQALDDSPFDANMVYRIENGTQVNIDFAHVYRLCQLYNADPVLLLAGDETVVGSTWPVEARELDEWDRLIRTNLRTFRGAVGTPTLGREAGVEQAWIVRIESGEYKRLDMIRLYRLTRVLQRSMREILT